MSIIQSHTTESLSDNWRTINIDALDPETSQNFDLATLHPAAAAQQDISESEIRSVAGQVRQALRGGDAEGALVYACQSAPRGALSESVKDIHLHTLTEVLQSIKASEMSPILQRIFHSEGGPDVLDTLMGYLSVFPYLPPITLASKPS
ncbi:MAG: hypothetical protein M1818_004039 [Claussenomyces sp. TS43310]|nr:MAG: hypothetical protein M1818_004039 [Claussenomyces sp. TS43310]